MPFDFLRFLGPEAANRLLQPSLMGPQNMLERPAAPPLPPPVNVGAAPGMNMPQPPAQPDPMPTAATQPMAPKPVAQTPASNGLGINKELLNDIFLGWAMGNTPMQSLALGAAQASKGKTGRQNLNQTVEWLKGRGMDEGQAKLIASNPETLQDYLKTLITPQDPMKALNVEKTKLEIDKMRNPKPDYQIVQDRSTGEVIAVDRNNPQGGPQVVRQGGMTAAPTTRTIKQPDGSEVAVQWDGQQWVPLQAPEGGNPVRSIPKLTEQQSKDLVYYQRGAAALDELDKLEGSLTSGWDRTMSNIPVIGNSLVSNNFQQAENAGRNFLASILRKDTGAAVTQSEMDQYSKIFLPQYGDSPETLAQKKEARKTALDAIRSGLGAAERVLEQPASKEQGGVVDYRQYFGGQ